VDFEDTYSPKVVRLPSWVVRPFLLDGGQKGIVDFEGTGLLRPEQARLDGEALALWRKKRK
jgi:hypothetical protein